MKKSILTLLAALSMISISLPAQAETTINMADPGVRIMGRTLDKDGSATMAFSGVELELRFSGSASIAMQGEVLNNQGWFNVYVDGKALPTLEIPNGKFSLVLADGLDPAATHTLRLVRRSESWQGVVRVDGFTLADGAKILAPEALPNRRILAIGDSITCGELNELSDPSQPGNSTTNAEASYEWVLAKRFDAQVNIVAYGGKGLVRDWRGTNTQMLRDLAADGLVSNPREVPSVPNFFERTLPDDPASTWDHSKYVPDLVIICIGQNDFSAISLPISEYADAFIKFVDRIHEVYPKAQILLLSSPMAEMSRDDGWQPRGIALQRALTLVDQHYIHLGTPFVMPCFVAHQPGTSLNAHPTVAQHQAMADEITPVVRFLTGWTESK